MVRVLELRFCQSFVIVHCAVPDKLHLWHPRNGLEVRMKDGLLGFARLVVAMTVRFGRGVERLGGWQQVRSWVPESHGSQMYTFVSAYCSSGVTTTFRNKRAPCWSYRASQNEVDK